MKGIKRYLIYFITFLISFVVMIILMESLLYHICFSLEKKTDSAEREFQALTQYLKRLQRDNG